MIPISPLHEPTITVSQFLGALSIVLHIEFGYDDIPELHADVLEITALTITNCTIVEQTSSYSVSECARTSACIYLLTNNRENNNQSI